MNSSNNPNPRVKKIKETVKPSYTLDELKKIPDYNDFIDRYFSKDSIQRRKAISFGNLTMLGDLPDREKDASFNPSKGEWGIEKNIAFIAAAIQQGRTFRLITPLYKYRAHCEDKKLSGTMCEILLLLDHGYKMALNSVNEQMTDFYCRDVPERTRHRPFTNYWLEENVIDNDFDCIKALIEERSKLVEEANKSRTNAQDQDWRRRRDEEKPAKNYYSDNGPSPPMASFANKSRGQLSQASSNHSWRKKDSSSSSTSSASSSTSSAPRSTKK